MTLALVAVMVGMTWMSQAQSTAIERYFKDYRLDDRFTHVSVSNKMFDLFLNFEREDEFEQQVIETISKLDGLKVLIAEHVDNAEALYRDLSNQPYLDMEELMDIRESGKAFRFFILESQGKITELSMVGYEKSSIFILSLIGDIDLKEISKLSEKMNIDGFEHFKNIEQ